MLAASVTVLAIINGIAIIVLVLVTAYYAWQTHQMAREMREARLLSLLPKIVLDIRMLAPNFGIVRLQNVGSGPALRADLQLVYEPEAEDSPPDRRRWLAHVIAPGERHEFLPPTGSSGMDGLVERFPSISLRGEISDAFGRRHDVDERIQVAEWWEYLAEADQRWQEVPAEHAGRELERSRKQLEKIADRLSVLATVTERWWRGRSEEGSD